MLPMSEPVAKIPKRLTTKGKNLKSDKPEPTEKAPETNNKKNLAIGIIVNSK